MGPLCDQKVDVIIFYIEITLTIEGFHWTSTEFKHWVEDNTALFHMNVDPTTNTKKGNW